MFVEEVAETVDDCFVGGYLSYAGREGDSRYYRTKRLGRTDISKSVYTDMHDWQIGSEKHQELGCVFVYFYL